MWMWVHVFGVTSNWILPLSSFRPWFAFAEKVFFVRSQRWLKRGIFYPDPLCNLNTCESLCPLLKIIPPRTSPGQEGLLSPISSSIPLSTKVSDKRLISFLSSQRDPISGVVIWPFPIASVHLLETIWKLIQLSDLSIWCKDMSIWFWCRAKTKTLQVDLAFPPLHSLLNFSRFVFWKPLFSWKMLKYKAFDCCVACLRVGEGLANALYHGQNMCSSKAFLENWGRLCEKEGWWLLLQLLIEIIAANFPHSSTGVSLDRRKIFKHKAVDCHVACLMAGQIFMAGHI